MAEVILPTWIIPEKETYEWLDESSVNFPAAFAPGITQRQSYGGLRLKVSRQHTVRAEERAQLLSTLARTKGRYVALRTKIHNILRGSMPASETFTNNTFASGTSGWGSQSSTNTVTDRIMRVTASGQGSSPGFTRNTITITQYAPYVLRAAVYPYITNGASWGIFMDVGSNSGSSYSTVNYCVKSLVSDTTSSGTNYPGVINDSSPNQGDYIEIPWCSLTRCMLVDTGLNALLQSDELDATWTALRASVDDQAATAPDGSSNADSIIEDTSNNTHQISQSVTVSSAAGDYALCVALKAGARTWAHIIMSHATGSATAWINLSTGALGTVSNGTDWTNARGYVATLGNGWYVLCLVARKTSAATSISAIIRPSTADSVQSYLGDGTSNILAWRATMVQSSVPTRLISTTTTAVTGTAPTGSTMLVKGLPASTTGLLLPGDWFEINGELKQVTMPLNSNGAGCGVLQFEPPLVRSPANDDPIIVGDPMGKFLVSNVKVDNEFGVQSVVTYDLDHIYE